MSNITYGIQSHTFGPNETIQGIIHKLNKHRGVAGTMADLMVLFNEINLPRRVPKIGDTFKIPIFQGKDDHLTLVNAGGSGYTDILEPKLPEIIPEVPTIELIIEKESVPIPKPVEVVEVTPDPLRSDTVNFKATRKELRKQHEQKLRNERRLKR